MEMEVQNFLENFKKMYVSYKNKNVAIKKCRKYFNKFIRNALYITTGFLNELESICPGFVYSIKYIREVDSTRDVVSAKIKALTEKKNLLSFKKIQFSDTDTVYHAALNYNSTDDEMYMKFKSLLKSTLRYSDTYFNHEIILPTEPTKDVICLLPSYYQRLLEDNKEVEKQIEQYGEEIERLTDRYAKLSISPISAIYDYKNERYIEVKNSTKIDCVLK